MTHDIQANLHASRMKTRRPIQIVRRLEIVPLHAAARLPEAAAQGLPAADFFPNTGFREDNFLTGGRFAGLTHRRRGHRVICHKMGRVHNVKNALVMRGGALGDFILTLPVLAALRSHFPGVRLELLAYPRYGALAQAAGLADAVASVESPAFARFFVPDARPDRWFARFQLVVSYLHDPGGVLRANILRSAPRAHFLSGPHRPDESLSLHAADALLEPLATLGLRAPDSIPRLDLGHRPLPPGGWLALHPGSGSPRKNWPEENWRELLRLLLEKTGFSCLLVGGEAEQDRLNRLRDSLSGIQFNPSRLALAQNLPLVELARRLCACDAFIGHDSGITHLAAALGLPGLVLWGESNQIVWRPRASQMTILRYSGGLSRLPVPAVFGNVTAFGRKSSAVKG